MNEGLGKAEPVPVNDLQKDPVLGNFLDQLSGSVKKRAVREYEGEMQQVCIFGTPCTKPTVFQEESSGWSFLPVYIDLMGSNISTTVLPCVPMQHCRWSKIFLASIYFKFQSKSIWGKYRSESWSYSRCHSYTMAFLISVYSAKMVQDPIKRRQRGTSEDYNTGRLSLPLLRSLMEDSRQPKNWNKGQPDVEGLAKRCHSATYFLDGNSTAVRFQ